MITKGINYEKLFVSFKKGLRNGNWRTLRFLDKALYRAAMGYAKHHCIINEMLVEKHFFQKEIFTKETILNYFILFIPEQHGMSPLHIINSMFKSRSRSLFALTKPLFTSFFVKKFLLM